MPKYTRQSSVKRVVADPAARAAIASIAPEFLDSPYLGLDVEFPLSTTVDIVLGVHDERAPRLLAAVLDLDDPTPVRPEEPAIEPNRSFEGDDIEPGSAFVEILNHAELHETLDIVLHGPSHGNPFVDVEFGATFALGGSELRVGGFYDGNGRYVIRFLPPVAGRWAFTVHSTTRSLNGVAGSVDVADGNRPGQVVVDGTRHFRHADGTPFRPLGTTSYAWTHQSETLQDETVEALRTAPFNKIRMGVFPKHFIYNRDEPGRFAFPRLADGSFDTTRFDLEFFHALEARIRQLDALGVQVDLILFHPYDAWGFADLGRHVDERYLRYVVRRFAGLPNVWWSMANEYDLLLAKTVEDWHRLGRLVRDEDHAGHLISVHNWVAMWDHSADWVTHASVQGGGPNMAASVDDWRRQWKKPIVVDEFGYEGDLDQGWGNLLAEEVVNLFWSGALRGAYLTHGETFYREDEQIHWAKGGAFVGEAPKRLGFLQRMLDESPTGRFEPLLSEFDAVRGGVQDRYVIIYFGSHRPRFRDLELPEGRNALVDVLDVWNGTVDELGEHSGSFRVQLQARPYTAIRLRYLANAR